MGSISYFKTPGRTTDQELRAHLAENLPTGHRVVAQATRSVYGSQEWSRELFATIENSAWCQGLRLPPNWPRAIRL